MNRIALSVGMGLRFARGKLTAAVLLISLWMGLSSASALSLWPLLGSGQITANNFSFEVRGIHAGYSYHVYATSDWINWAGVGVVQLGTTRGADGYYHGTFTDSGISGLAQRFYMVGDSIQNSGIINSYSISWNSVGYVRMTAIPGYTLIANQLNASSGNTIAGVFAQNPLPAGTEVYKYNGVSCDTYSWDGSVWSPNGTESLSLGDGCFVKNNGSNSFTVTLVGEVPQGTLTRTLPAGYSLGGSMVPQTGGITSVLGYVPADEEYLLAFDSQTQGYIMSMYYEGYGWIEQDSDEFSEPSINVGQAFYLWKYTPGTWTRTFWPKDSLSAWALHQVPQP